MGSKQSKRSVDISGKEGEAAAGGGEVAAAGGEGRVEPIADVDALKPQLNGDTPHIEPPPEPLSEKEKQLENGTPENEKDASTEKEQMAVNGAGEAHDAANGEGTPAPEPEKKKKEKVKKKWSLRSISFSRKEKPKHEKKQKEEDKVSGEQLAEEAAEATVAESKAEEVAAAKPDEAKELKTPDTPVTEPITNGSSAPESPKDEAPAKEASPATEPQVPLTNGSTAEAKPAAAEPASTPDTPVTREVCVAPASGDPAPPPPLPANPPPSSFAAFAETAMAPLPADAVLAAAAAAPQETSAPICEAEPTPIPDLSPVAAAEPTSVPEPPASEETSPAPQTVETAIIEPTEHAELAQNPTELVEPAQKQTEQAEPTQNSTEPAAESAEQTSELSERIPESTEIASESTEIVPEPTPQTPEKCTEIYETKESGESNSTHAVVEPEPEEKLETPANVEPANVPLPISDDEAQNEPEEAKSESDLVTNGDNHLEKVLDSASPALTNGHANGSMSEPLPPPAADEDASGEDLSDSFPLPPSELCPGETHQIQETPAAELPKDSTLEINSDKTIADMKEAASAVAAERSAELTEAAAVAPTD